MYYKKSHEKIKNLVTFSGQTHEKKTHLSMVYFRKSSSGHVITGVISGHTSSTITVAVYAYALGKLRVNVWWPQVVKKFVCLVSITLHVPKPPDTESRFDNVLMKKLWINFYKKHTQIQLFICDNKEDKFIFNDFSCTNIVWSNNKRIIKHFFS